MTRHVRGGNTWSYKDVMDSVVVNNGGNFNRYRNSSLATGLGLDVVSDSTEEYKIVATITCSHV